MSQFSRNDHEDELQRSQRWRSTECSLGSLRVIYITDMSASPRPQLLSHFYHPVTKYAQLKIYGLLCWKSLSLTTTASWTTRKCRKIREIFFDVQTGWFQFAPKLPFVEECTNDFSASCNQICSSLRYRYRPGDWNQRGLDEFHCRHRHRRCDQTPNLIYTCIPAESTLISALV